MKKLIAIFLCLFLVGCSHTDLTNTVIEKHQNIVLAINNPITGINYLDKKIDNYITNEYNNFINSYSNIDILNEKSELNIDYTYNVINERFYSVCLFKTIRAFWLPNPITEVKTFVYDLKNKKSLTIYDIVSDKEKFISCMNKYLNSYPSLRLNDINFFALTEDKIVFYFNSNSTIISIEINYEDLPLTFKPKNSSLEKNIPTYKQADKVIDPNKPVVALTFDDGPSKYTREIVEVLDKYNACATFFILGNKVPIYEKTLINLIKKGNEIGNHSYNHKWLTKLSNENFREQIDKTQNIIKDKLNYEPKYLRPTYGSVNQRIRRNTNLEIVLWNVDTLDWKIKSSSKIAKRTISKVKNGDIILMHDTHERTLEAIKKIVPELQKHGYQFVTISELKEYQLINEHSNETR